MADSHAHDPELDSLFALAWRHWNVSVTCAICQHRRVYEGHQLWWLFHRRGWNGSLSAIRKKLYCGRCWSTDCRKTTKLRCEPTRDLPNGDPLPWPSDRDWKRAVSELRG
jgi:hypothetical protein